MAISLDGTDSIGDLGDALAAKAALASLQVVSATYATQVQTTSTSYVDSGLTATITPTSATSKILVIVVMPLMIYISSGTMANGGLQVLRGATSIADTDVMLKGASAELEAHGNEAFLILDAPATASATTYKVQGKLITGTMIRMQQGNHPATIVLKEIPA
jgi:hypothetical protein